MRGQRRALATALTAASIPLVLVGTAAASPASSTAAARTSIQFGASHPDSRIGPMVIRRTYGVTPSAKVPSQPEIKTFANWSASGFDAFIRNAPAGTQVGFLHEPENNIESGKLSAATWASHQVDIANMIVADHRVGQVFLTSVLMRWTLQPQSHRTTMLAQLMTPAVIAAMKKTNGVMNWDSFGPGAHAPVGKTPARTPDDMYGVAARWSNSHGMRWGIAETGQRQNASSNPTLWANWWQGALSYIESSAVPTPPVNFVAWNPTDKENAEYAIQIYPQDAAVWKQFTTAARG